MTVFVAWIRLFFELHQFPMVGLYVEMLQKILQQFINVSLVAVVLVFSFGIPFYMAFHDPTAEVRLHTCRASGCRVQRTHQLCIQNALRIE